LIRSGSLLLTGEGIVGFEEVFHPDVLQRALDLSGLYNDAKVPVDSPC
jgi:hypothetical protein